jgi:hypothetical protein
MGGPGSPAYGYLACFQDGDWQVEIGADDPAPGLGRISTLDLFDLNARGDLLARGNGPAASFLLFKSAAGIKVVHSPAMFIEGRYKMDVADIVLQDDGTAYFAGFDQDLRYRIVRAEPF